MQENRIVLKILTGKLIGKRPLGRPKNGWEDNIRMNLKETGTNTTNWANSIQGRDYWRFFCEFCIESQGSISHGVS